MNRFLHILATIVLGSELVFSTVVKLDVDTFDTLTAGKTVFIKFFAPWCGHCKKMASDWEKLGEEWENHSIGLIAEVDCTEPSGQPLCEDFGVEGFPTLMYGDPSSPEAYEGGRDFDSLSTFAKEHLNKVYCSVRSVDGDACSDDEKKVITGLRSKTKEELDTIVQTATDRLLAANEKYEKEIEELQATYERITTELNDENDKIRSETHLKYVNQILALDYPEEGTDEDPSQDEL